MDATAVWRAGYVTRLGDERGHEVTVDLPADEGGTDLGTSALELAVESLAGCISTIFALVAGKRRIRYDGLRIDLTATRPKGAPTIERVHGTVEIATEADREDVETAVRLTVRTCPVGVIFERAGIPIELDLVVNPPRQASSASDPHPGVPVILWNTGASTPGFAARSSKASG
jgi:putative redox protein